MMGVSGLLFSIAGLYVSSTLEEIIPADHQEEKDTFQMRREELKVRRERLESLEVAVSEKERQLMGVDAQMKEDTAV